MQSIRCPNCGLWPVTTAGRIGPGGFSTSEADLCVSFRCYGFCPFGLDCSYDHPEEYRHHGVLDVTPEALTAACVAISQRCDRGTFICSVCRERSRSPPSDMQVGETFLSPFCAACGNFYFQPYVQTLALLLLKRADIDYSVYKASVDTWCSLLPVSMHVPFMYECHRWATSRFSWSLFDRRNASDVMRHLNGMVSSGRIPRFHRMVSMGAGRGYFEHLMKQEAPEGCEVDAFDRDSVDVPRTTRFSVPVRYGTSESLLSYDTLANTILLLSWPPFGSQVNNESTMAYDTVTNFEARGGCALVYVGDPTATGDWRYHEVLQSRWEPEAGFRSDVECWVPEKMGLIYAGNDNVMVYRRRDVPLILPPMQWMVQR